MYARELVKERSLIEQVAIELTRIIILGKLPGSGSVQAAITDYCKPQHQSPSPSFITSSQLRIAQLNAVSLRLPEQYRRLCELAELLAHLQVDIVALSEVCTPRYPIATRTLLGKNSSLKLTSLR